MDYVIAEFNQASLKKPIDHLDNEEFVANLSRINSLAETSPGFIWRLIDENGYGATQIQAYQDPRIIINLSVWKDINSLYNYTYKSAHNEIFSRRREWFEKSNQSHVLWWIPENTVPTLEEGIKRLNNLKQHGANPYAFTMHHSYPVMKI